MDHLFIFRIILRATLKWKLGIKSLCSAAFKTSGCPDLSTEVVVQHTVTSHCADLKIIFYTNFLTTKNQ